MSKYEQIKPERPELDSVYAGKHVWNIGFEPLGNALYVGMGRGIILPDQSFGGLYEDEGGVLSVSNDEDQHFWRAVHAALIKEDATISYYTPIMSRFFRSYKYKHEFVGRDRSKMLELFYPGVHDVLRTIYSLVRNLRLTVKNQFASL